MSKNSKVSKLKKGATITFTAIRLTEGNPVKGELISEDDEWISVKLAHYCAGIVREWKEGELYTTRKSLIKDLKSL